MDEVKVSTENEAMDVVNNEANPHHAALHDETHVNHASVKAAIEGAFKKANPERAKTIAEEQQAAAWSGAQPADAQAGSPARSDEPAVREQAGGAASSEPSSVDKEMHRLLSEKWGDNHAENSQRAGSVLRSVFPTVEHLLEFARAHGLDKDPQKQVEILDLLARLGSARR